jgi:small subunit ribosomal protein S13
MAEETHKIVRVMRRDLPGDRKIENALRSIKGVDFMMARAIRIKSGLDPNTKLGDLPDDEIAKLTKLLEAPEQLNLPVWMLNRRLDPATGKNSHIFESDLDIIKREDLGTMKKIKCYRGYRHMFGLPCRGQRTRSTGRKERTIGVVRKKTK